MLFGWQGAASVPQTIETSAPGGPGLDAHWPSAAKVGFGTANTLTSKIWFTLAGGVMTEIFYPTLDVLNTQALQLIICKSSRCQTEADDTGMVHGPIHPPDNESEA